MGLFGVSEFRLSDGMVKDRRICRFGFLDGGCFCASLCLDLFVFFCFFFVSSRALAVFLLLSAIFTLRVPQD